MGNKHPKESIPQEEVKKEGIVQKDQHQEPVSNNFVSILPNEILSYVLEFIEGDYLG